MARLEPPSRAMKQRENGRGRLPSLIIEQQNCGMKVMKDGVFRGFRGTRNPQISQADCEKKTPADMWGSVIIVESGKCQVIPT